MRQPLGRPPRLPETMVARDRLYAALDKAVDQPLTQLIAPAGTGKTMLLTGWASRRLDAGDHVSWIPAHEHKEITARLCAAVGRRTGPVIEVLGRAQSRGTIPGVVVIDDAHLLPRDQLQLLSEILTATPDAVRLVLATRRDLPLPIVDLELTDRASALRINDLRFTDEEAAELVFAHVGGGIRADHISLLVDRTAGWAAALVLAARSLASNPDPGVLNPALIATDQPVLDHLLGDAFTMLSERAYQVLLSTFSEPYTSAGRAGVLSGNPDAGDILADLTGRGLLVTAYNTPDEVTYRYHPLLVELLRRRVVNNRGDAEHVRIAHVRSAEHAESQGQHAAALASATEARNPELVSRILVEYGPELLSANELETVAAGFDVLGGDHLNEHPWLLGVRALHRRCSGDISGAVMASGRASRAAAEVVSTSGTTDADQALQVDALMLRLWQSRYGWQDADATIADARALLGCDHRTGPSQGHRNQLGVSPARLSWLLIELAAAEIWVGDLAAASVHLDEALVSAGAAGHHRLVMAGLAHRAVVEFGRGDARSAATTAQRIVEHSEHEPLSEDDTSRAHVILGLAAHTRLDVDAARKWQDLVEGSGVSSTDSVVAALRTLLQACLLIEEGEVDLAGLTLTADPAAAGPLPTFLARELCLVRYHCATQIGDRSGADEQIATLRRLNLPAEADLLAAKLAARTTDPASGVRLLTDALRTAGSAHPPVVAWAEARRVAMLLEADQHDDAYTSMVAVIAHITPQHMVRSLTPAADEPAFVELVGEVAAATDAPPYASVVAEALAGHLSRWKAVSRVMVLGPEPGADSPAASPPARGLTIPAQPARIGVLDGIPIKLTARESDVLGQLALGSSYTEIAKDLFITENTVKTHLASLYRKLGVDKRSAALRVARNVGLLV